MTSAELTTASGALYDLILSRRSVGRVLPDRPPRELIERLLDAACSAPNHHLTQPWRFVVVTGDARERVGQKLEAALRRQLPETQSAPSVALLAKERAKLLRAPVVLVLAVRPSDDPRVVPAEDVQAGAAAAQNVLLAAQSLGLGAMWRTGHTVHDPEVKRELGLAPDDEVVGFIYLGYPDPTQPPPARPARRPARDLTQWLGWEE